MQILCRNKVEHSDASAEPGKLLNSPAHLLAPFSEIVIERVRIICRHCEKIVQIWSSLFRPESLSRAASYAIFCAPVTTCRAVDFVFTHARARILLNTDGLRSPVSSVAVFQCTGMCTSIVHSDAYFHSQTTRWPKDSSVSLSGLHASFELLEISFVALPTAKPFCCRAPLVRVLRARMNTNTYV